MKKIRVFDEDMNFVLNDLPSYPKWFAQWLNVISADDLKGVQLGEYVMVTDGIRIETVCVHGLSAMFHKRFGEVVPMVAVRL